MTDDDTSKKGPEIGPNDDTPTKNSEIEPKIKEDEGKEDPELPQLPPPTPVAPFQGADLVKLFFEGILGPSGPLSGGDFGGFGAPKPLPAPKRGTQLARPPTNTRAAILAPLDEIFLDDELIDDVIKRVSVPELLDGKLAGRSGVILYGPPGTGKTVLLEALGDVYRNAGAYAKKVSFSEINDKYVGNAPKNLEREIKNALAQADKRGKTSLVYLDEATSLVIKAKEGATSVSRHYDELIDVLKQYLGNDSRLAMVISTNAEHASFDEALTRDARLTTLYVGFPDLQRRTEMWEHFSKKYDVVELTTYQATQLAELGGKEQGAFVDDFLKNYYDDTRDNLLKEKTGQRRLLDALKSEVKVADEEVRAAITYERLFNDVEYAINRKMGRNAQTKKPLIGFGRDNYKPKAPNKDSDKELN